MSVPLIYNIQQHSIHHGEGIRTTMFFKGCPLKCAWCSNPESQSYTREVLFNEERCVSCKTCMEYCPAKAISVEQTIVTDYEKCNGCGICVQSCLQGARELEGQQYQIDQLLRKLAQDRMFYKATGGGITLSGGEVMSQDIDYIKELVMKLSNQGFHIAIDTSGYAPYEHFKAILPYVNIFLYDVKIMDPKKHKQLTGVDNHRILSNLINLSRDKAAIDLRLPLISEVNDSDEDINAVIHFLKGNRISCHQITLIPYKDSGSDKYGKLARTYKGKSYTAPEPKRLIHIRNLFRKNGIENIIVEE